MGEIAVPPIEMDPLVVEELPMVVTEFTKSCQAIGNPDMLLEKLDVANRVLRKLSQMVRHLREATWQGALPEDQANELRSTLKVALMPIRKVVSLAMRLDALAVANAGDSEVCAQCLRGVTLGMECAQMYLDAATTYGSSS